MQAAGSSDSAIISDFIKAYGQGIYRAEPNSFGWLVPYLALALGVLAIIWFVRRSRRPGRWFQIAAPAFQASLAKWA